MDIPLNYIISAINIILALVSIFYAILILLRCSGKLKIAIIFLIFSIIIFITKSVGNLMDFHIVFKGELFCGIVDISIMFFMLLALITLKQMISAIDNHNFNVKK